MSDVEIQDVPKDQYVVAEDRTEPIRRHYLRVMAGQSVVTKDLQRPKTLTDLCVACYLQGLIDAGTALAQSNTGAAEAAGDSLT